MRDRIEQVVLVAMASLSIIVSLLDLLGVLDSLPWLVGRTPALTLLVVGFIIGYLVLERRSKLDRLEDLLSEGIERTIRSFDGVAVKRFKDRREQFGYIVYRIRQAKEKVCDLSWGPTGLFEALIRTGSDRQVFDDYLKAIEQICTEDKIEYRDVMIFPNLGRLNRAEVILSKKPFSYHLRYYDLFNEQGPPRLIFMVIDSEEVILVSYRRPYLPVEEEIRLAVKHPDIVRLFQDYYNTIWQGAKVIKEGTRFEKNVLKEIRQQLEAKR